MTPVGALALVLHAHLPYVRHPDFAEFMEEDWLFEAITETYLPLLDVFEALDADGLPLRITMTLSPPLCEMLADPLLQQRYLRHLANLVQLAEKEANRLEGSPSEKAARLYLETLTLHLARYQADELQLLPRFKRLQDKGLLEIVTCCGTHGFLPLMATEAAVRAQLVVAVQSYERHFGCRPRGIWLAECGYRPGLDALLSEVGLRYFFVDTHGLLHADPPSPFGTAAPIVLPAGVAAFARDPASSAQVWSAETGYPGNPVYREFYRDLGWDADMEYIRPHLHADGFRRNLGIKYHRITGPVPLHEKLLYDPEVARKQAARDALHFLKSRAEQLRQTRQRIGRLPLVLSPYDAELYGHWWFEGPWFLEALLRQGLELQRRAQGQSLSERVKGGAVPFPTDDEPLPASLAGFAVQFTTPAEYLEQHPHQLEATMSMSSWGAKGYGEVWLNPKNAWIYPYLHDAEHRMIHLAQRFRSLPPSASILRRALNQAGRELLLAQSSDWAFIITQNTTVPYAEKRTREHLTWFGQLAEQIEGGTIDEAFLARLEWRNPCFPDLDYRVYAL